MWPISLTLKGTKRAWLSYQNFFGKKSYPSWACNFEQTNVAKYCPSRVQCRRGSREGEFEMQDASHVKFWTGWWIFMDAKEIWRLYKLPLGFKPSGSLARSAWLTQITWFYLPIENSSPDMILLLVEKYFEMSLQLSLNFQIILPG